MLILLGIVAFLGLNLILHSYYKNSKSKLEADIERLSRENMIMDRALVDGESWMTTNEWFEEHQVLVSTLEEAQNALLKEVQSAAERCKLIIAPARPIQFLPPVQSEPYSRVRVSISFTASESNFFQWTTQMNDPAKFRTITNMKVVPTADRFMITVTATVEQFVELPGDTEDIVDDSPDEAGTPQPSGDVADESPAAVEKEDADQTEPDTPEE